jgi:hypothetical protein
MADGTSALILTVSLAVGLAGTALAADSSGDLEQTLQTVPTVTGLSAYRRIEACGIKIERSSFSQFTSEAFSGQVIKPGDGMLMAVLTLPSIPGTEAATAGDDLYRTVVARWYVWKGKVWARNGWAQRIQYQPRPLEWMNC